MLKRMRVDNFKSLINVEIQPARVNLLTGHNNSGKTTICQALQFLKNSVYLPISDAAAQATGDFWNITNAYLARDIISFELDCDLSEDSEPYKFTYSLSFKVAKQLTVGSFERECHVQFEALAVTGGKFTAPMLLMENDAGNVRLLHEGKQALGHSDAFVETTAPTNATMLSRLYDLQHNRLANTFKRYLGSWLYYDFDPTGLRSPDAKQQGLVLNTDGSNLSHVLFQLKSLDEKRYRTFVKIVQEVEPKLDSLNFAPPTQESVFMFLTDTQDNRFGVSSISNGTLRFMAMAYILVVTPAIAGLNSSSAPLVIIEEPENGIYVGHLKKLMDLVGADEHSNIQLVFSSHSPYFIDLFDRYLDGVFVVKSEGTHSKIRKPSQEQLEEVLGKFDLGEAHFQELLG